MTFTVARNGDMGAYDELMRLFRQSDLHEEKERLSTAMGRSSDVKILQMVLDFAIGDEIRSQDTPFVIAAVATNPHGKYVSYYINQNVELVYYIYIYIYI